MSTQEERLETVEYNLRQFKTETIRAYQDMAFEMTMIKGLTEDTIKRLAKLSDTMEKRFEQVDTRLDRVESMLAQILARLPEKP
jgi:phosphoenolpyruvate synthase/pyruvate phosphate dikinase